VVNFRRRNGNLLKFQDIFRKLEKSLDDIIVPAPSADKQDDQAATLTPEQEDDLAEAVQLL